MKRVSRSLAAGKTSIPPTANSAIGNTSVVVNPALTAACSASPPGTAAACATKESTFLPCAAGSSRRSAKVNVATSATSRIVPWRKSAGPSTAMAPIAAILALVVPKPPAASPTTAAKPAASASTDSRSWAWYRLRRGRNASRTTPTTAAPSTISAGASWAYSIFGAGILAGASAARVHRLWTVATELTSRPPHLPSRLRRGGDRAGRRRTGCGPPPG